MLINNHPSATRRINILLDQEDAADIHSRLQPILIEPIEDLNRRPSKGLRSRLVDLSFRVAAAWSGPKSNGLQSWQHLLSEARLFLERVHLASLIIDDIQDDSTKRRGEETLHIRYGLPIALNSGNWLYFSELSRFSDWNLSPKTENQVTRLALDMFNKAHLGQACDVGLRVDTLPQSEVFSISRSAMRLKTGALSGFSLSIGGILAGLPESDQQLLDRVGRDFGVVLQMLDDLGPEPIRQLTIKQAEDFDLRRVTWWFGFSATELSPTVYDEFIELGKGGNQRRDALLAFLSKHNIWNRARQAAESLLQETMARFDLVTIEPDTRAALVDEFLAIASELKGAYEKL